MPVIVITGATSGIGLEAARLLARQGFSILGVGRTAQSCARAQADLLSTVPGACIRFHAADLLQQREVLQLAATLRAELDGLSGGSLFGLILNAGCARARYMTTEDGYEQQFALNYLSGFLLSHELLPALLQAGGRVILTGSGSHKGTTVHWDDVMLSRRYRPLVAYQQSKLCDLLLARALNDRYAARGLHAYAVDPGLVRTDIGNKAGGIVSLVWSVRKRHGVPPAVPAQTYAFLCSQEPAPTGLYYAGRREQPYSRAVTGENADRLMALSHRLCGLPEEEAAPCQCGLSKEEAVPCKC